MHPGISPRTPPPWCPLLLHLGIWLMVCAVSTSPDSGCNSGSVHTFGHTSDMRSAVRSLRSLCLNVGIPSVGQVKTCSTMRFFPHTHALGISGLGWFVTLHVHASFSHSSDHFWFSSLPLYIYPSPLSSALQWPAPGFLLHCMCLHTPHWPVLVGCRCWGPPFSQEVRRPVLHSH